MKYTVTVARTSVRLLDIEIEAESEEDAHEKALDDAGNHDFSGCSDCGVEYDVDGILPKEKN